MPHCQEQCADMKYTSRRSCLVRLMCAASVLLFLPSDDRTTTTMENSDQKNVSIDEGFKSNAYARLVESGERDRLTQELRRKLSACGWDERLRKYCAEVVRERGVNNITLEGLLSEVTPVARSNVPAALRKETTDSIRNFLTKELANR